MAKVKSKTGASIPQKHVHARVSYLYQAASYLANSTDATAEARQSSRSESKNINDNPPNAVAEKSLEQSRRLLSHLRGVSRKAQTRVRPEVKRAICKRCDCILIPGRTSTCSMENASLNGRKPWADVLVYRCNTCQATKRFPVGQSPGRKQVQREAGLTDKEPSDEHASGNDIVG